MASVADAVVGPWAPSGGGRGLVLLVAVRYTGVMFGRVQSGQGQVFPAPVGQFFHHSASSSAEDLRRRQQQGRGGFSPCAFGAQRRKFRRSAGVLGLFHSSPARLLPFPVPVASYVSILFCRISWSFEVSCGCGGGSVGVEWQRQGVGGVNCHQVSC